LKKSDWFEKSRLKIKVVNKLVQSAAQLPKYILFHANSHTVAGFFFLEKRIL